MATKQYAKLVMVTPDNNNKYYEMTWDGGSTFKVKYGRIESTAQTATYPYSKWSSKYNEKIRKGYKDVTDLVSVEVKVSDKKDTSTLLDIKDKVVNTFMNLMKKYTDGLVSKTYSVKADAVSQKQVDTAQDLINEINALDTKAIKKINEKLVELYMVIPRYMGQVQNYLLPSITIGKHMAQEQDNLDAMAAQVSLVKPSSAKADKAAAKKAQTLLDQLGITMSEVTGVPKDLKYLLDQSEGKRVKTIFEVNKPAEDAIFDKWMKKQTNTTTRILIHGTRCTSVIPILEIGLKIRPVGNFQFSGKAYGNGNYFSEHMQKSMGYTGYDPDHIILVYEVHTGNPFVYDGWYRGNSFTLSYPELSKRGYDSTFVKAGHGLLNSEIIAYKEEQCRIKYILWCK